MGYNQEEFISKESGGWSGGEIVRISPEVDVTSVATVEALPVASGVLVTKVGVWITAQIKGDAPDIDVGDGVDPDAFIDGLATCGTNILVVGPNGDDFGLVLGTPSDPYVGGLLNAAHYAGKRYTGVDTIDVDINTAASRGSLRVVAWMVAPSDLGV